MTQPTPPRRGLLGMLSDFHAGGFTGGIASQPPQGLPLLERGEHRVQLPGAMRETPIGQRSSFTHVDTLLSEAGESPIRRMIENAIHEAAAREVALQLIRDFGVAMPLQSFRGMPRPLDRMASMVLDKLEAVGQHLGTP